MSIFNEYTALTCYQDANPSSNPQNRMVDWRQNVVNVAVDNPLNEKFSIPPAGQQTVFSSAVSTSIDGTTAFQITINPTNSILYRVTYLSGTAPGFRTSRGLTLSGDTVTVVVNNNVSVTFTLSINNFSTVSVGDTIFIPTTLTGDSTSPFNLLNGGFWTVIGKASGGTPKTITAVRFPGVSFSGASESIVQTTNSQFQAFSSAGVQVGNVLQISSGFSLVTQQSAYQIATVTSNFVEFLSSSPLPLETGIMPGNAGMSFYGVSKRFVRIEVDQPCYVQFNGSTDTNNLIIPRLPGDLLNNFGWFEKWSNCFEVNIVNKSQNNTLNVIFISAQ
jgi:hypothetical protein